MAKRSMGISFATVALDEGASAPLYRRLYDRLRTHILTGQLQPGARLPSSREMAAELKVSRNTVMNAFDQLLAEGYIEGQVGSGTFVSSSLPDDLLQASSSLKRTARAFAGKRQLSRRGERLASTPLTAMQQADRARPFATGTPALEEFPAALWSRLVARQWRNLSPRLLDYGEAAGYRPLREAIAAYLGPSRAVRCQPEQVIIVGGTQQALDLSARVLLDDGDAVLIEEYCYLAARAVLLGAGARLIPVPLDDEGIDVASIARLGTDARLVYVTPSHQYPLGVTMSLGRRLSLLDWANRCGAWILEDDYDSEYRYTSRPLAALQGLDKGGRVIYMGTFSKVLAPTLRIGYLVVPPDLVEAFTAARALTGWCSPLIDQAVLADFLKEGHFARHLRRMRPVYAERQAALVEAAGRETNGLLSIKPDEAGIHLTAQLPDEIDARRVAVEAAARGVIAQPLSSFAAGVETRPRNGLVLGYGAYSPGQIREAASRLAQSIRAVASTLS